MCSSDIFLGLIAILFPPLAVWVKTGLCSADSLINILLCCLGFIPGLLHAWYIIAKFPEPDTTYSSLPQDPEAGNGSQRVTYVYVQAPNGRQQRVPKATSSQQGYGTTAPMAPSVHQQQNGTWGGEGSTGAPVPPTYDEAVQGDHKVQSRD